MSRLVKIVDNKNVQIEEHKSPNICFNTNEYDDFEDYCTLRETFDPFEMFYENQELQKENKKQKEVIDKAREELKKGLHELDTRIREEVYIEQYIEEALDILKGSD